MSDALDQLLFTWSPHGTDGRQGFQVIAASDGLRKPSDPLTMEVVRLCRYEAPLGERDPQKAPVSYGWLDRGPNRFVFHRSYAGKDAGGRPGNFVAHVVAGPSAALPITELPKRFASRFWWHGVTIQERLAAFDGVLSKIKLGDIDEGPLPKADKDALHQFVATVLAQRQRVVVPYGPAELLGLVAATLRRVPDLLMGKSFSTYEPPDTAGWFDISGGCGASLPVNAEVERAAQVLLSDDHRAVTRAAFAASKDTAGLLHAVRVFDNLATTTTMESLRPIMSTGAGVRALVNLPVGVQLAARAIVNGESSIWQGIQQIENVRWERPVAAAVADHVTRNNAWHAVPRLLSQARDRLFDECCTALCDKASTDPQQLAQLNDKTALVLLDRLAATSGSEAVVDVLLTRVRSQIHATLGSATLPLVWRARVFAAALSDRTAHPVLATFARAEPGLVLQATGRPALLAALLRHSGSEGACRIAQSALPRLQPHQGHEFLASYVAELSPADQLAFLQRCLPPEHRHRWQSEVHTALVAVTTSAMATLEPYLLPAFADLAASAGPIGVILHCLGQKSPDWHVATELRDEPEHQLAAEVTLSLIFQQSEITAQLRLVIHQLDACWPSAKAALTAVLRAASRPRAPLRGPAAAHGLLYAADVVSSGRVPLRRGRLPKELNTLAVELAMRCPQERWLECDAYINRLPTHTQRWWRELNKIRG